MKWNADQPDLEFGIGSNRAERRQFMFTRAVVIRRGIMFMGLCWEVQGRETRVTECIIVWFAMFSYYDGLIDLMKEVQ